MPQILQWNHKISVNGSEASYKKNPVSVFEQYLHKNAKNTEWDIWSWINTYIWAYTCWLRTCCSWNGNFLIRLNFLIMIWDFTWGLPVLRVEIIQTVHFIFFTQTLNECRCLYKIALTPSCDLAKKLENTPNGLTLTIFFRQKYIAEYTILTLVFVALCQKSGVFCQSV